MLELGVILLFLGIALLAGRLLSALWVLVARLTGMRQSQARPFPKWIGVWLAAGIVVVAASYFLSIRPFVLRGKQVRTCADVRSIATIVEQFKEDNGRYPRDLSEVLIRPHWADLQQDVWGHKILYQAEANSFIVASFGRDGRPDRDYLTPPVAEFHRKPDEWADVRGLWSADTVVTDAGWYAEACK